MAKRVSTKGSVVVCNVGDQRWIAPRDFRTFVIEPCPEGERCSTLLIEDHTAHMDVGDNKKFDVPVPAEKIGEDITRDLEKHGVFVCAGDEPTDEEIEAAKERLKKYYQEQVFVADQEWSRHHNYTFLSDVQRRAVKFLGLEREWAFKPEQFIDCPVCGESVKPGVAVCKGCGAILDPEKAAKFGVGVGTLPPAQPAESTRRKPRTAARR